MARGPRAPDRVRLRGRPVDERVGERQRRVLATPCVRNSRYAGSALENQPRLLAPCEAVSAEVTVVSRLFPKH